MIEFHNYLKLKGIGRRAFYYQLEQGKIFKKEVGRRIFVIDPQLSISDEAKLTLKQEALKELEMLTLRANAHRPKDLEAGKKYHSKEINAIITQMLETVSIWQKRGVDLRGWSRAACYRKIENPEALKRKTRSDIFGNKNEQLANPVVYEKLKALYFKRFFESKEKFPSKRRICKQISMFCRKNEEFYEIAAIPFSTLYDNIKKMHERYAHEIIHLYKNNYSDLSKHRVYNEGAFTADMEFMEWYAIDDHVHEIEGAWIFNTVKGEWEKKKVYSWVCIECKTMFPIVYHTQADNFNGDDIKLLLLKALMNAGRPVKGILMDNGLASTKRCRELLDRLGVKHDSGKAYDWMHKAIQERIFGFVKTEFASEWNNYIGGGRSEVRHTSNKMSPEQCDFTAKQYIDRFDNYMEGFYQTVERDRTDNYKKVTISVREDFENRWLKFTPEYIDAVKLRFSYMLNKVAKMSLQHLSLGNEGVYTAGYDNMLDPVLQMRDYMCYYNPLDLSECDIYALENILIQKTGEMIEKGQYVATLSRMRDKVPETKRRENAILNKKNFKMLKAYAENTVDITLAENFDAFGPELNEKGQILDTRKGLHQKALMIMQDAENKVKEVVIPDTKKRGRKPAEEAELTPEELQSLKDITESGEYDD